MKHFLINLAYVEPEGICCKLGLLLLNLPLTVPPRNLQLGLLIQARSLMNCYVLLHRRDYINPLAIMC